MSRFLAIITILGFFNFSPVKGLSFAETILPVSIFKVLTFSTLASSSKKAVTCSEVAPSLLSSRAMILGVFSLWRMLPIKTSTSFSKNEIKRIEPIPSAKARIAPAALVICLSKLRLAMRAVTET